MHKPWHSLLFLVFVFSLLGIIGLVFPAEGIRTGALFTWNFPSPADAIAPGAPENENVAAILESIGEIDTSFTIGPPPPDTLPKPEKKKKQAPALLKSIQMKDPAALEVFFEALKNLRADDPHIRVLHYGDSQIEGDRITDYLRLKLQGQFGGSGPGLISLLPVAQSPVNRVSGSDSWDRYTVFTVRDKRVEHNNFGPMAGFCRFSSIKRVYDTTASRTASVEIRTTSHGGPAVMNYSRLRLFYGGAQRKTWVEYYEGPALAAADSLSRGGYFNVAEFPAGNGSFTHSFRFRGKDSPDFYGLSLETEHGIMVDNIPLRGSSGTFFHQINPLQLKNFFEHLNVKLVILQFGGNAIPSIRDSAMAQSFGNYVRYQISTLRKSLPGASILFIGPSDMSTKTGTDYVTYPMLEPTRDAIRKAVLENGCAYFDLYDCMGGKNSMPEWVEQKLAATDYIHFSPQGARKIATMMYSALIQQYNEYLSVASKK